MKLHEANSVVGIGRKVIDDVNNQLNGRTLRHNLFEKCNDLKCVQKPT